MLKSPNELSKLIYIDGFKIYANQLKEAGLNVDNIDDITEELKILMEFYFENRKLVLKLDDKQKEKEKRYGKRKAAKKGQ